MTTALATRWAASLGKPLEMITLPVEEILRGDAEVAGAAKALARLRSDEWVFGGSPSFQAYIRAPLCSHQGPGFAEERAMLMPDLKVAVKRGRVVEVVVDETGGGELPTGGNSAGAGVNVELERALSQAVEGAMFSSAGFADAAAAAHSGEVQQALAHISTQLRTIE